MKLHMWPISINVNFVPIPFIQRIVCEKFVIRSPKLTFHIDMAHQY